MTTDHTALIAEARREAKGWRSVNNGNAALSWGKAQLFEHLADALEQVTEDLQVARAAAQDIAERTVKRSPVKEGNDD